MMEKLKSYDRNITYKTAEEFAINAINILRLTKQFGCENLNWFTGTFLHSFVQFFLSDK